MSVALAGAAGAAEPVRLVSSENPPFAYAGAVAGQVHGVSTEMAREAARRASVSASVTLLPWPRAYSRAQTDADTCVFPVARLPEREALFRWIGPLNKNRWVLFARPDFLAPITSVPEARRYRIGGLLQDGPSLFLLGQGVEVDQVATNELNLNKLMAGRIDLWATGFLRGKMIAAKAGAGELKVAHTLRDVDHYMACNPKLPAATLAALEQAVAAMWQDGTMRKISEHYRDNPPE
ncbi:ABC transporter substrate-binding protein [Oxalobacteraceae bacterium]|nr:ABC transporter substrate-binding protein [Oxalobacteraceae bacterium]